jgi:putative ABC transport system permease protein
LVSVTEGVPGLGFPVMPFAVPDYLFVAANNRSFAATGAYRTQAYEVSGAGEPRRINGARATLSLFDVLGISPAMGRLFTQEEDEHSTRVAILSFGFAQSTFGEPERALGRTILLDRTPYSVIGVMPRSFSFPIPGSRFSKDPAKVFVPVSWSNDERQQTVSNFDYSMIARLNASINLRQAGAEVHSLLERVVEDYPPRMKQALSHMPKFSLESQIVPFREEYIGNVERPLLLLLAAVGIVLLVGCADVANLMFSRMVGRQREFALRTALGAGRWRLTRQTITEGLILSVTAGGIGLCLAYWTLPLLIRFAPDNLPRLGEVGLNWRMMLFAAAVALATPLVFCLGPLADTLRSSAVNYLRGEGRTTTRGKGQQLMMSAAVITQFSLAFLLLTTAGLLTRSLLKASEANPGFRPEHMISTEITLPGAVYKTPEQKADFFDRLLSRLSTLPSVRQTGAVSDLPMGSTSNVIISIEGRGQDTERVDTIFCRGEALQSLGITLLQGRLLRPEDQLGRPHATVISETLAKRLWPQVDPVGKRIRFGVEVPDNDEPWMTVVGVVADVKARLTSDSPRMLMFLAWQDWVNQMDVIVRTSGNPLQLSNTIRAEIHRVDPGLPVGTIKTVGQVLDESLSAERFRTWLLVCFAVVTLLLATLGIAGLLAYTTAQRTHEFGVRIALGANRRALLLLILKHCLKLAGTGIGVGLLGSFFVSRVVGSMLYDTTPHDPAIFVSVPSVLALIALGASVFPAWRAVRMDPVVALRAE